MQKTQNYNLNQWEPTDKLNRADFNADNAAIDAALAAIGVELGTLATSVAASGNCRIATGSYTGTGTYGADKPNSLSFDFSPSIIIMRGNNFYNSVFIRSSNFTTSCAQNSATMKVTWTEYGISWYSDESAVYQNNANANTYYYVALG